MARPLHYLGVTSLLLAALLLLITTISAPVIPDIAILKITLTNQTHIRHSSVTFGAFGHCVLDVAPVETDQDYCFPKAIGYAPAKIMEVIDGGSGVSGGVGGSSADGLTRAFVLHPIACGLAFIAFFLACAGRVGALLGAGVAGVAWVLALVVMAVDFAAFGIIKNRVNGDGSGSHAFYSVGMWTCLAAMILLFVGMVLVFFTCCGERRKNKNQNQGHVRGEKKRFGRRSGGKRHGRKSGSFDRRDEYVADGPNADGYNSNGLNHERHGHGHGHHGVNNGGYGDARNGAMAGNEGGYNNSGLGRDVPVAHAQTTQGYERRHNF